MDMTAAKTKTGLMYSELSGRVYWGTMNEVTGIARNSKKDVTSDFIGVMLKKFPVNTIQNITCNGKPEVVIMVLDSVKAERYKAANDLYSALKLISDLSILSEDKGLSDMVDELLERARGEHHVQR